MVSTRPSRVKGQLSRSASKRNKAIETLLSPSRSVAKAKHKDAVKAGKTKVTETPAGVAKSKSSKDKVRVWWPPTKDKKKTDFAGAYWPATITRKYDSKYEVKYDNGEISNEPADNVSPDDVPTPFGKEDQILLVGEFCEVSNSSKTDPGVWLGRVASVQGNKYTVEYPFHDSEPEVIENKLLRRARVWESKQWKYIQPNQDWEEGEVTHPSELILMSEKEFFKLIAEEAAKASKEGAKAKPSGAAQQEDKATKDKAKRPKVEKEAAGSSAKRSVTAAKAAKPEADAKPAKRKQKQVAEEDAASDVVDVGVHAEGTGTTPAALPLGYKLVPMSSLPMLSGALPAGTQIMQLPPGVMPQFSMSGPAAMPGSVAGASGSQAPDMESMRSMMAALSKAYGLAPGQVPVLPGNLPFPLPGMRLPAAEAVAAQAAGGSDDGASKTKRRKRDPDAPKKPPTGYTIFMKKHRHEAAVAHPDVTSAELTRIVAAMWRDASVEEREACEKEAEKGQAEYVAEMEQYMKTKGAAQEQAEAPSTTKEAGEEAVGAGTDEAEVGKTPDKKAKKPESEAKTAEKAKKAAEKEEKKVEKEKEKEAKAADKEAKAAERAAEKEARAVERAAKKEMEEGAQVAQGAEAEGAAPGTSKPKKRKMKKQKVPEDEQPPKRPRTSFILFSMNFRQGLDTSKVSFDEATKATANAWHALSVEERKKYDDMAEGEKDKYNQAYEEWQRTHPLPPPLSKEAKAQLLPPQMVLVPAGMAWGPQLDPEQEAQQILNYGLDPKKCRDRILRLFGTDGYLQLLDVWREGSPRVGDAVRSFKAHVQGQSRPDWKAFMVSIFGLDRINELAKAVEDKREAEQQQHHMEAELTAPKDSTAVAASETLQPSAATPADKLGAPAAEAAPAAAPEAPAAAGTTADASAAADAVTEASATAAAPGTATAVEVVPPTQVVEMELPAASADASQAHAAHAPVTGAQPLPAVETQPLLAVQTQPVPAVEIQPVPAVESQMPVLAMETQVVPASETYVMAPIPETQVVAAPEPEVAGSLDDPASLLV